MENSITEVEDAVCDVCGRYGDHAQFMYPHDNFDNVEIVVEGRSILICWSCLCNAVELLKKGHLE